MKLTQEQKRIKIAEVCGIQKINGCSSTISSLLRKR